MAAHDTNRPLGTARDQGSILVLTLLLTVVLATIALALATYATAGARASRVTTELTQDNVAATGAITWAIEEFAAKRLTPDGDCAQEAVGLDLPAGLVDGVDLTCAIADDSALGNPQVLLEAGSAGRRTSRNAVSALVEVPTQQYLAQVNAWSAD